MLLRKITRNRRRVIPSRERCRQADRKFLKSTVEDDQYGLLSRFVNRKWPVDAICPGDDLGAFYAT